MIQRALNALADDHRAVVVMKEFDGLHYEEIAAILGIPVGTVRSRLHRARLDLRERLKGLVQEDEPAPLIARPHASQTFAQVEKLVRERRKGVARGPSHPLTRIGR